MWSLLAALRLAALAVSAPADEAWVVETIAGDVHRGALRELSAERVVLVPENGAPVEIPLAQAAQAAPLKAAPPAAPAAIVVELIDGSTLAASAYTATRRAAAVTLAGGPVEIPTSAIRSARFREQPPELASQWSEILGRKLAGDALVVRKATQATVETSNGPVVKQVLALDFLEGVLNDVTADAVRFEFDGEALGVNRSKVDGVVYFQRPRDPLPPARARVVEVGGGVWQAQSVTLENGALHVRAPSGVTTLVPLARAGRIDLSLGKIVHLGDLKPVRVEVVDYYQREAETAEDRQSRELWNRPATEKDGVKRVTPVLAGTTYDRWLAMHSRSLVEYQLPGEYKRFTAVVGIDGERFPQGAARLVVSGDVKTLLDRTLTAADGPQTLDLDLTGQRRLRILVDYGPGGEIQDNVLFGKPRIVQ